MINDEVVAQLEAERLRGMPRWQVRPAPAKDWQRLIHTVAEAVADRPMKREPPSPEGAA